LAYPRPAQIQVIRRDGLAVSSVDEGRTQVLYTASIVPESAPGYQQLGPLLVFAYDEVQPGSGFKLHAHDNVEVITIVLEGTLDHEDTAGHKGRLEAGEVALMSAGTGVRHSEFGSRDVVTRSLTIWIKPRTMNKPPSRAVARPVERDGWQLVAAERDAPLVVDQDARVIMQRLAPRERVNLEARPGRVAYLAVVQGEVAADGERLARSDRMIVRGGKVEVAADAGATVVAVDVPATPS
jgi:redox-sensitive bicupin YhaK (pirin superfamily)